MATFAELVDDVKTLTARPDLLAEIELAVRAATLKAHHSDFFTQDVVEESIKFASTDYIQTLQYKQLFPRWRKVRYIRKWEGDKATQFLELIAAEDSIDMYNDDRTDVAYNAGNVMKLRTSTGNDTFLIGYYQHPVAVKEGYRSWIADEYPFAIIYDAAATVFQAIGQQEKVQMFLTKSAELYRELKINCVSEVGE